jgi:hypothetical protein
MIQSITHGHDVKFIIVMIMFRGINFVGAGRGYVADGGR